MKRSEEAHLLLGWSKQLGFLYDPAEADDRRLKMIDKLRRKAISTLEPITPPGADLRDFDYVPVFCFTMKEKPEHELYEDALTLLRMCTYYLKRGKVEQSEMHEIILLYAGSNKAEEAKEVIHEKGQKTGKSGGDQSGKVRRLAAEKKWALWQAEADKIWLKHPAWSKRSVAAEIVKKYGGSFETVRRKIKNPLPQVG